MVGYVVIVYGVIVEDDCFVGMCLVVLNGVRIGLWLIIVVGVIVIENVIILEWSLVMGILGKVVGWMIVVYYEWICYVV